MSCAARCDGRSAANNKGNANRSMAPGGLRNRHGMVKGLEYQTERWEHEAVLACSACEKQRCCAKRSDDGSLAGARANVRNDLSFSTVYVVKTNPNHAAA